MKIHKAVKIVEESLNDLYVLRIGSANPAEFKQGDHPDIREGKYMVVDVTVAVPDTD